MNVYFLIESFFLVLVVILIFTIQKRTNTEIENLKNKIENLSKISSYFPEFIEKGEMVTRSLSEELTLKKNILDKLIKEAESASERLGYIEQKIKDHKMNNETINKILILINQGFTPKEISPRLNIPVGEIELVVKLRKFLNSPITKKL